MKRKGNMRVSAGQRKSLFIRAAAVIIVLCMVAALALPALAADTGSDDDAGSSDTYSYTVRLFAGKQGKLKGENDKAGEFKEDELVYTVRPGETISINYQDIAETTEGSKYYVSGFRESGKDNNTRSSVAKEMQLNSFVVERDMDFVVSYGVKGDQVAYTIHYLDAETKEVLHEPVTYYGNANDKPVVSYRYIDGYTPRYENITGTLKKDAANDWVFYYDKMITETTTTTTTGTTTTTTTGRTTTTTTRRTTTTTSRITTRSTTTTTTTRSTNPTASTTTTTTTTTTTAAGNPAAVGGTGGTPAGTGAGTNGTGTTTTTGNGTAGGTQTNTGPGSVLDLDDPNTPLAEYGVASANTTTTTVAGTTTSTTNSETEGVVRARGLSTPLKIVLGVLIALLLGGAGWFFFRHFANDDDDDDDDDEDEEEDDV